MLSVSVSDPEWHADYFCFSYAVYQLAQWSPNTDIQEKEEEKRVIDFQLTPHFEILAAVVFKEFKNWFWDEIKVEVFSALAWV